MVGGKPSGFGIKMNLRKEGQVAFQYGEFTDGILVKGQDIE
jgi:hypothetical protein